MSHYPTVAFVALAAAVYATASLNGRWLGTPPWWEERVEVRGPNSWSLWDRPRDGRKLISGSIAVFGYALFAVAAWPEAGR